MCVCVRVCVDVSELSRSTDRWMTSADAVCRVVADGMATCTGHGGQAGP